MKFSIRDLLFVTFIVALVLGWVVDHQQQDASIEKWKDRASKLEFAELARQVTEVRRGMNFIPAPAADDPPKP